MSSAAKNPRLWLPVCCFLATVLLVPLTCQLIRHTPKASTDLAEQIAARHDWRIVPQSTNPEDGCYVMTTEFTGEIRSLMNAPHTMHQWHGVVMVVPDRLGNQTPEIVQATWGEYGLLVGNNLIIGDPVMLRQITRD